MVTSTTLGMALAAEPAEPDVMERAPRPANKRLIGKLVIWRMLFVSHVIVALVLGSFYWGERQGYDIEVRRAEAFCCLVATQVRGFGALDGRMEGWGRPSPPRAERRRGARARPSSACAAGPDRAVCLPLR
jgi:hypothetical protein